MKKLYFVISALLTLCVVITTNAQNVKPLSPLNYTNSSPSNFTDSTVSKSFTVYNGIYYFIASADNKHKNMLWRSDGTADGTYMVNEVSNAGGVSTVEVADNKLYAFDAQHMFIYDGTSWKSLLFNFFSGPGIIRFKNATYFMRGANLVKSDETVAGTTNVLQINYSSANKFTPLSSNSFVLSLSAYNNGLTTYPNATYISDGTKAGTVLLDINMDNRNLVTLQNKIYFINAGTLYSNPGSPDAGSSQPVANPLNVTLPATRKMLISLPVINNTLFFAGTTAAGGTELYKYNTVAAAGIELVKDIVPGTGSGNVDFANMVAVDNTLYFAASDAAGNNILYKSDGTEAGTVPVKNFGAGTGSGLSNFSSVNGEFYFDYNDNVYGKELWKTDGTEAGTVKIKDINPGLYSSNPAYIAGNGTNVLFAANDGVHGTEIWKTDGTEAGTNMVKDIDTAESLGPVSMRYYTNLNNTALFSATDNVYGNELWITDGTRENTKVLKDILPGSGSSYPSGFNVVGSKIFFLVDSALSGLYQLWQTDGTTAGTFLIKRFNTSSIQPVSPRIQLTGVLNGKLYFEVINNSQHEVWISDGTETGTGPIFTIPGAEVVAGQDAVLSYALLNNKLYFSTRVSVYIIDGTPGGTVKTLSAGGYMYVLGNTIFINKPGSYVATYNSSGLKQTTTIYYGNNYTVCNNKLYFFYSHFEDDGEGGGTTTNYIMSVDTTLHFSTVDTLNGDALGAIGFKPVGTDIYFQDVMPDFVKTYKTGIIHTQDSTIGFLSKNFIMWNAVYGNGRLYFNNGDTYRNSHEVGVTDGTYAGSQLIEDTLFPFNDERDIFYVNNHIIFSARAVGGDDYLLYSFEIPGEVMPVTLTSFTAKLRDGNGLLNWSTATEQNSDYFAVQRSPDGLHFTNIGRVAAAGNSTYRQEYDYTDYKLSQYGVDKLYYRLQQFDKDGKFTYSKIVPLNINTSFTASISPIPVANQLNVNITSAKKQTVLVTVVDMTGKVIASYSKAIEAGATTVTYNAAGWAKGVYQVHITQANGNKQTISVVR